MLLKVGLSLDRQAGTGQAREGEDKFEEKEEGGNRITRQVFQSQPF